jgi:hypothetical protein
MIRLNRFKQVVLRNQSALYHRGVVMRAMDKDDDTIPKKSWNPRERSLNNRDGFTDDAPSDINLRKADESQSGFEHDREEAWAHRRDVDAVKRMQRTGHASFENKTDIAAKTETTFPKEKVSKVSAAPNPKEREQQFKQLNDDMEQMEDRIR